MLAAILVVAAFAAFSAAAVFEDSQSDAASITDTEWNLAVPANSTLGINYDASGLTIVIDVEGISDATGVDIKKDANFSGKLYFGTYDTPTKTKFNATTVISLTNVSGVELTQTDEGKPVVAVGSTTGTIKVTEGQLQLGDATDAFNGTASGNTVEITSQNTGGLTIVATADKKTDQIYGDVSSIKNDVDENPVYAIDIDGNVKFDSEDGPGALIINSYTGYTDTDKLVVNINDTFDVINVDGGTNGLDIYDTVVNVNGTLNIDYEVDLEAPVGGGTAEFNINGTMKFTNVTNEAKSDARMIKGADVNAAFYSVKIGDEYTHTYTTLENAMTASDTIFVTGEHFITKDTTLTGTSGTENKISFMKDAEVRTGVSIDSEGKKAFTAITVTVPVTTELEFITDGIIVVEAGKLICKGTSDAPATEAVNIKSDVFMKDGNDGIYTDLATALEDSKSGDTVKIRGTGDVSVKADATVKDGVTLDANNAKIIVDADVTFTIDGEVNNAKKMTVEGTLVLNSADFDDDVELTIGEEGVLIFSETFDNTAVGAAGFKIVSDNVDSVIDIDGKVVLVADTINGTVNVNGEAKIGKDSSGPTIVTVNVYGTLIFTDNVSIATLFVADGGDVSAIDGITAKTITVTGEFTAGTAPEGLTQYVNGAKAKITLGNAVATVYGEAEDVEVDAVYNTAYNFDNGSELVLYATVYTTSADVKIYDLDFPTIDGKRFMAWYSLPSLVDSSVVNPEVKIGTDSPTSVYAGLADATITVNLQNVPNATWVINEKVYASGSQIVEWAATYTIELKAANGYKLDGGDILVNGVVAGDELANGDSVTFSGNVVPEEVAPDTGLDMQTVLLAVIAAAAVVMAIVFIIRMMRS